MLSAYGEYYQYIQSRGITRIKPSFTYYLDLPTGNTYSWLSTKFWMFFLLMSWKTRVFLFSKQIFCGLNTYLQLSKAAASQFGIFVQSWLGNVSHYGHIVAWWTEHWLDLCPHTQPQMVPLWAMLSIHGSPEITLHCLVIIYILTFTKILCFSLEILSFRKRRPMDGLPFSFKSL